jgi:periplasmic mercuric ion binding protein
MKKYLPIFFTLMILIPSGAMAANRTVLLKVQNMTCPVCPLTVKKALAKVAGVQQVEIDYETKTASVQFDDAVATIDKLIAATTEAGYPSTIAK